MSFAGILLAFGAFPCRVWGLRLRKRGGRGTYLEGELHLARLGAVDFDVLEDLVVLGVGCLAHVPDAPRQAVLQGLQGLEEDLEAHRVAESGTRVVHDHVDDVDERHLYSELSLPPKI